MSMDEFVFVCEVSGCVKAFATHTRAREHMRLTHSTKRIVCPGCAKSFKRTDGKKQKRS